MSDPIAELPDVVIFFDANMPNMDACSENCIDKSLVFCRHRFDFNACLVVHGRDINGLNDFCVARFFLNLVKNRQEWNHKPRPKFVLVTKDHDFIIDVQVDYFDELEKNTAGIALSFVENSIWSGDVELRVVIIQHRAYGENKISDLRRMIKVLNLWWAGYKLSK